MKLAYERPVMRAELFQTNAYCAMCEDNPVLPNGGIKLSANFNWFKLSGWNGDPDSSAAYTPDFSGNGEYDFNLTFDGDRVPQHSNTTNTAQYYWETTSANGDKYYLEYSTGWTEKNNSGADAGESVFVLYKEYYDDSKLNVAWGFGYGTPNFPGTENDADNWEGYPEWKWDDAIAAFTMGAHVQWSN